MADFFGYNPPFIGGLQNILSRQEDIRLIKNDILQLLGTVPGERVMRPEFGVNLRNFVFEQATEEDIDELRDNISDAIARQEVRVTVDYVLIQREDDYNRIKITIVSRLVQDPTKVVNVETFLNLPG